jgi:hypothetical protein
MLMDYNILKPEKSTQNPSINREKEGMLLIT